LEELRRSTCMCIFFYFQFLMTLLDLVIGLVWLIGAVFDTFDEDCDGYIDKSAAIIAAYCGGPLLFDDQVEDVWKDVDKTNVGKEYIGGCVV
jgi:hypothetical protein